MSKIAGAVGVVLVGLLLLAEGRLALLEPKGPAHFEVELEGGGRATLYQPGAGPARATPVAPDPALRPPALVLVHGYSMDRAAMSGLARRVASAGIAVLAIDVSGHGNNPKPFPAGYRADGLAGEVAAGVRYLRDQRSIDGLRIAVGGHSMGAGAALDYATRDPALAATVLISGGRRLEGAYRPSNALFLWASRDPERTRQGGAATAAAVAGTGSGPDSAGEQLELGRMYGAFRGSSAVRAVEVPDTDHVTILYSDVATDAIVGWLHEAFEMEAAPEWSADPRLPAATLAAGLFLLVLPFVGLAVGRLAPVGQPLRTPSRLAGLLGLAVLLAASLPLLGAHSPADFLGIDIGSRLVVQLALAGGVALAALVLRGDIDASGVARDLLRALPAAALGFAVVYSLQAPLGAVFHRLALTPERVLVALPVALGVLPFVLAFHLVVRRGQWLVDLGFGLVGRAIVLGALLLGVSTGVLRPVLMLMLPLIALQSLLFEILATSVYWRSHNAAAVAWLEAAWYASTLAAVVPLIA